MADILAGYMVITTITPLILVFGSGFGVGFQWVNPIIIYDNVPVNWFGCIVLTVLAHIAAGPWVIFYWFYKLCTVGRK